MPPDGYAPPIDVTLGSDGHCTGFPDGIGPWNWQACCMVHDEGGSDGRLLDCIAGTVPSWAEIIVVIAIGGMVFFRPLYNVLQKLRIVK